MSAGQKGVICEAIADHENILVAGGTNSGKTALCNAIIEEITAQFPDERIVILEDTGELQCAADDHLQLQTSEEYALPDLVKSTLRTSPDRIIVGEKRRGFLGKGRRQCRGLRSDQASCLARPERSEGPPAGHALVVEVHCGPAL